MKIPEAITEMADLFLLLFSIIFLLLAVTFGMYQSERLDANTKIKIATVCIEQGNEWVDGSCIEPR